MSDEEGIHSDEELDVSQDDGFRTHHIRGAVSDREWKSGTLLYLRERFYMPFEALEFVDSAFEDYAERRLTKFQVDFKKFII